MNKHTKIINYSVRHGNKLSEDATIQRKLDIILRTNALLYFRTTLYIRIF